MAFNLDNMATVLRAAGLKVVEVPGWQSRGYAGQDLKAALGVLWHHTATNRLQFASNNMPTLGMLANGRSDLPGPLCNLGFGRDGTVYVVATGVANHAGAGVLPGIPKDMGNHYLIGIEMESSGVAPWDWTPEQLYWAPRLGAALERAYLMNLPEDERIQAAHYEYSSQGKIDPAGWPGGMDGLRASINKVLNEKVQTPGPISTQGEIVKPKEEAEMLIIARDPATDPNTIWVSNIITRRHVKNPKELEDLRKMHGWGMIKLFDEGRVQELPIAVLGVEVKEL